MARLQLRPGLRRLWRDQSTLQLGLSPTHGAVLAGLRAGDEAVISALDGSHDLEQVHALARARSVPRSRVDELVRLLGEAGVLVGGGHPSARPATSLPPADRVHLARLGRTARRRLAPDAETWSLAYPGGADGLALLARRADRQVMVDGAGRLGAAVAVTLTAAGVGRVDTDDDTPVRDQDVLPGGHGADAVGSSRATSVGHAFARVRGAEEDGAPLPERRRPDLVVLVRDDVVEVGVADALVREGLPHLAVVIGADRVVVGPLVLPGRGPCLRCLDLHRRDRDPAWPHLAAQLVAARTGPTARGETASSTAAAGLAALHALTFLDGLTDPVTCGRTLELTLPDGLLERRRWQAHPSCGCARLPAPPGPESRGTEAEAPAGHDPVIRARMQAVAASTTMGP